MAATFSETLRSLRADDRPTASVTFVVVALFLGAGLLWFFRGHVTVYAVSDTARIEVKEATHFVDAPIGGRIASTSLVLGAHVERGQVLVELDSELERRKLAEEQTHLKTIEPELEAIRRELAAAEQALRDDAQATLTAMQEGQARTAESRISAAQAAEEAKRGERLLDGGAIPELEALRLQSEAETRSAATGALSLDVRRLSAEQRTRASEGLTRVEGLLRDVAALEGAQAKTRASLDVLEEEVARHVIVAPVSGLVGELATLKVGAYVHEGERLGSIVPAGELKVVAEFLPRNALGRVRPGQSARLRLDGFPWIQYGMVSAVVRRVGTEVRDGHVRVELDVVGDNQRIPLQHGLPGSAEVEIEHVSPARLTFRSVGKLVGLVVRQPVTEPGSGE